MKIWYLAPRDSVFILLIIVRRWERAADHAALPCGRLAEDGQREAEVVVVGLLHVAVGHGLPQPPPPA
eukprot:scaffold124816_cov75-Phaeocystis_antarctica.AAC.1